MSGADPTDSLKDYRRKRNPDRTPEPSGKGASEKSGQRFVIQKHDASRLHYDFRLETEGVLKSWAVPKGPSTDPREKRLAILTEDHPIDYFDFEGVIPEGEYGGGTVMVWDWGTYRNLREEKSDEEGRRTMAEAFNEGLLEVWLEGEKLRGGYALKKMSGRGENQWLLIKMRDEEADARRRPVNTEPDSVKTGRDLEAIEAEEKTVKKESSK